MVAGWQHQKNFQRLVEKKRQITSAFFKTSLCYEANVLLNGVNKFRMSQRNRAKEKE